MIEFKAVKNKKYPFLQSDISWCVMFQTGEKKKGINLESFLGPSLKNRWPRIIWL
jgi:hypothetical protein